MLFRELPYLERPEAAGLRHSDQPGGRVEGTSAQHGYADGAEVIRRDHLEIDERIARHVRVGLDDGLSAKPALTYSADQTGRLVRADEEEIARQQRAHARRFAA